LVALAVLIASSRMSAALSLISVMSLCIVLQPYRRSNPDWHGTLRDQGMLRHRS
jgi:hypothetical protein